MSTDPKQHISSMLDERARRWDSAINLPVKKIAARLLSFSRGLARLDIELIEREAAFAKTPSSKPVNARARVDELEALCTLSTLWVFGAYEVIRTMDESQNRNGQNPPPFPGLKQLKRRFERVRIPLAKLQKPSRAASPGDSGNASPSLHDGLLATSISPAAHWPTA